MARLAWQSSLPQPSSRHLSISVCVLLSLSIHSTLFFCSATLLAICLCQGALSFVFSLTLDTPYDVPGLLSRGQHSPSCLAPREKVGRSTRRTTRTRRNQRRRLHLFQMSMLLFIWLLMMVAIRMEWLNDSSSDIQVLKTYGAAPYATALKKLEKQINETEGSVNEKIGVKVFSPRRCESNLSAWDRSDVPRNPTPVLHHHTFGMLPQIANVWQKSSRCRCLAVQRLSKMRRIPTRANM